MNKKYIVKLTEQERQSLEALVNRGRVAARKVKRAWILLQADAGEAGPSWPDEQIQQAYDVGLMTLHRVRQTLVEEGLSAVPGQSHQNRAVFPGIWHEILAETGRFERAGHRIPRKPRDFDAIALS